MASLGIPNPRTTAFVLVDVQDKLFPHIHDNQRIVDNANTLLESAYLLESPIIVTEQYPKGLGHTVQDIQVPSTGTYVEKVAFSCTDSDQFMDHLKRLDANTLVLFGIESHICVTKTALGAMDAGYDVHVVADGVSSRTAENKQIGIERMRQSGAFIASTEMILFQMLDMAGTDTFKKISKMVK